MHILRNEKIYKKKYESLKKEAWSLVNNKNISKTSLNQCYNVIRDTNKKMRWLSMVKSGEVSLELIKDEYGSSEVFYLEKYSQNIISDEILNLNGTLKCSIDNYLARC